MTDRERTMAEMLRITEEDFEPQTNTADMAYVNSELALALIEFLMEGDM